MIALAHLQRQEFIYGRRRLGSSLTEEAGAVTQA